MYDGDFGRALLAVVRRHPERPALWVRGQRLTYTQAFEQAGRIAAAMRNAGINAGDRVGIPSHRTPTAYLGILAALPNGCTYVPLNTRFPAERNASMLRASGASAIIVDDRCVAFLEPLLAGSQRFPLVDRTWFADDKCHPFVRQSIAAFAARRDFYMVLDFYSSWGSDRPLVDALEHECRAANPPFVDILRYVREESGLSAVEFRASPFDGHPSDAAHRLVARRIIEELRDNWSPKTKPDGTVDERLVA
jgi:acyl-CoA synthetase (AMP-forming)/AMP-acid ligase II